MSIGSNIKKRRFELGLSQQGLADLMGYKTRSTIAKIESGENEITESKIRKFALVLNTTFESLIGVQSISIKSNNHNLQAEGNRRKNIAVILAGGKSNRNFQNVPNQFIDVFGKPLILLSLDVYQKHPLIDDIYVVCLKGWETILQSYIDQYHLSKVKKIIPGGTTGIQSVKGAVDYLSSIYSSKNLLIFQEATRPMVSAEMISKLLQACETKESATIGHNMEDHVQFAVENNKASYINRDNIIELQSPEAYTLKYLQNIFFTARKQSHQLAESCCAMLIYHLGFPINFIEGRSNNFKIVNQEDLVFLQSLIKA
jgi:2-C-methyl-D-erythritol 4-phosphate cytidylyltransferase